MKLITGNSHPRLAQDISEYLQVDIVDCTVAQFANTEVHVKINECIRNQDIFIIQTGTAGNDRSVNDFVMETLILINACKLSSAKSITVILASYPYARQDKKDKSRTPISARLMANLLETSGATRIVAVDLHAAQIQGFFDIPCDNLYATSVLCKYLQNTLFKDLTNIEMQNKYIFVSPDNGGAKRVTVFSKKYNLNNVIMHKQRDYSTINKVENTILVGEEDLVGKIAIIVDDMCDTMGTIIRACETLQSKGIAGVIVLVTHGIFSDPAIDRINSCDFIIKVIVTNTLPQEHQSDKIEVVNIAPLISDVIQCIDNGNSISKLFI